MISSIDPRVRELTRLKLALATFALQLDTFEVRAHGVLSSIGQSADDALGHEPRKGDKIAGQ
ncbi:MAG TPA: hypothetical protein VK767_06465 [Bradyrhizobium sp.]|jgi:hypothetical protein|nr:hypothetical protein [Bradyrhizobium sp.]